MLTGKQQSHGQAFHRRLLSEHNADFTLDAYVAYDRLKSLIESIEKKPSGEPSRVELEKEFFDVLRASYTTVKDFLLRLQQRAAERVRALHRLTEEEVRSAPADLVPSVYSDLRDVADYRLLNVDAFAKILTKFNERCARDSLDLQRRVREADSIIAKSQLAVPQFDADRLMNDAVAVYGVVHRLSYEQADAVMRRFHARDAAAQRRILPMTDAYYFQRLHAHRQSQGGFSLRVLTGTTNPFLAKMVCQTLQCDRTPAAVGSFANGEVSVVVDEAVRGDDVFVVQSMVARGSVTLSAAIMELALLVQTATLASAARVTAVMPYIAYTKNTASVSAIAEVLVAMGTKQVVTVDLYKEQVEGMFGNTPVANVSAKLEFVRYLTNRLRKEGHSFRDIVVVSPDSETVSRARSFADALMTHAELHDPAQFVPLCTAVKRVAPAEDGAGAAAAASNTDDGTPGRTKDGGPKPRSTLDIIGNVDGKLCVIIDCVIDEAIGVTEVARQLKERGASRIIALATHAILSGDARKLIVDAPLDEVVVTDSINQDDSLRDPAFARKFRVLSIAPLLAQAIMRVHTDSGLSSRLFDEK